MLFYALVVSLLHVPEERVFERIAEAGLSASVWAIKKDDSLPETEFLFPAEPSKRPNGKLLESVPRPGCWRIICQTLWFGRRSVREIRAGKRGYPKRTVVVLSRSLCYRIEVYEDEVGKTSYRFGRVLFRKMKPSDEAFVVFLGRAHRVSLRVGSHNSAREWPGACKRIGSHLDGSERSIRYRGGAAQLVIES